MYLGQTIDTHDQVIQGQLLVASDVYSSLRRADIS